MKKNLRLDIQGLRSLAVGSVVIEHAFPRALSGGYVGVDIFFVISGFLISSIISREIESSNFSIVEFYRRRLKRINPALFFIIIFTIISGYFLLAPKAYAELAKTTLSTLLFSSNFIFFSLTGYFDGSATLKPLLHTWSLAVEEQFYIFFPQFMLFSWKRFGPKKTQLLILLATIISIVFAIFLRNYSTNAAYYMLPARAFELLIGVFLGLGGIPETNNKTIRHTTSLIGLTTIFAAFFLFTPETPTPGIASIAPCIGAALIIYSGNTTEKTESFESFGGKILSLQPFVYIGSISYSLYLWHWPVLAIIRNVTDIHLQISHGIIAIIASIIAASISFFFIEKPLLALDDKKFSIFNISINISLLIGLLCAIIIINNGIPSRFSSTAQDIFSAADDYNKQRSSCHWSGIGEPISYKNSCIFGAAGIIPDIVVWGDSHGAELSVYLGERAADSHRSVKQITSSACPPAIGFTLKERPLCAIGNQQTLEAITADKSIHTVILAINSDIYKNTTQLEAGIEKTVSALNLSHKNVILIKQIPIMSFDPPEKTGILYELGFKINQIGIDKTTISKNSTIIDTSIDSIVEKITKTKPYLLTKVETYDPKSILCNSIQCLAYIDNTGVLYFNSSHLSMKGVRVAFKPLADKIF